MKTEALYTVKPEPEQTYTVCKFEDKAYPEAIYTVSPGERGYLECSCPARKVCKHIKLVVRFIRGDRLLFYTVENKVKPKKRLLNIIKSLSLIKS